jgi:hypothetical protein
MIALRGRPARLDLAIRARPGRWIVVSPEEGPWEAPGSVAPLASGLGLSMRVATEYVADPVAGLDARQRAALRPGDRFVVVLHDRAGAPACPEDPDVGLPGESADTRTAGLPGDRPASPQRPSRRRGRARQAYPCFLDIPRCHM